jgi:hypothetical protein
MPAPRFFAEHHAVAFVMVVFCATGCSRPSASNESTRQEKVVACVKAGDRCEFAPGKIGLCTASPEPCTVGPCLTCVSLH